MLARSFDLLLIELKDNFARMFRFWIVDSYFTLFIYCPRPTACVTGRRGRRGLGWGARKKLKARKRLEKRARLPYGRQSHLLAAPVLGGIPSVFRPWCTCL